MNHEPRKKHLQKPRIIKNKDIPLLARVLYIMQDVCSLEKRREWQKERMFNCTQRFNGMPNGKGVPRGIDAALAAIDELNEEHKEQVLSYVRELKEAEKIINGISSRTMRTFVTMLYVDNLPPEQVRKELNLTEWGFRMARDSIEQARDMESVAWQEKYIIKNGNFSNPS